MEHFSYSLLMVLFHSMWQACFLACIYFVIHHLIKGTKPGHKKNLLFILLAGQFILSGCTFFIYYTESFVFYENSLNEFSRLFTNQSYLEKSAPWIIAAYLFIAVFKTIQLMIGWQQFRIKGRACRVKPSVELRLFTKIKAAEFGIRRNVMLWYSDTINTALTFGFIKPVILLPVALVNNLTIAETETLIIHELTHIKSNDYFLNWLLIVADTVFFFNPFMKILINRLKLEREKNCDAQVLQFNYPPLLYAETLLKAARFKATPSPFFLAAVFKKAHLKNRIVFFTDEKKLNFNKRNYSNIAILPLLLFFVFNIFLVNTIKHVKTSAPNQAVSTAIVTPSYTNPPKGDIPGSISTIAYKVGDATISSVKESISSVSIKKKLRSDLAKTNSRITLQPATPDEMQAQSISMPVSLTEPMESKEIVLTEENSATGKSVTKVYNVTWENGRWKTTLKWKITESKSDSVKLTQLRDTSGFYNEAQ